VGLVSWSEELLERLESDAARCRSLTRETRLTLADTKDHLIASRNVSKRTILKVVAQKPRNLPATPWRSPRGGAYVTPWRAPVCGVMDDVKDITAFHLRRLRAESGLSQPALADRLGVDRRHVSRWERAEHSISWAHICKMAEIFGCNPGEFYVVPAEDMAA
jgi:DNA-binding XRE family transcriptional regulator